MQQKPRRSDGLCECGCGGLAPISPTTSRAQGYMQGKPRRFIRGHHAYYAALDIVPASDVDHAWAAGVFDGEGTVYITVRRKTYGLIVSIGQSSFGTEPAAMLLKLRSHYTGSLSQRRRPPDPPLHYVWGLSGRAADKFLRSIAPFVVQKREQVQIALEYREKVVGVGTKEMAESYRQSLREAKRR